MIPTDIYIELLKSKLSNEKSIYDYLQLVLPLISGIVIAFLGWFFSYRNNKQLFRQQLLKDKHDGSKEILLKIVTLHSEFIEYYMTFIRKVRDEYLMDNEIAIQDFEDFSLNCQLKYVYIQELISIEFPDIKTQQDIIIKEIDVVEKNIGEISRIMSLENKTNKKELIENEIHSLNESLQIIVEYTDKIYNKLIMNFNTRSEEIVKKV
jgi:hypothetical protein